MAYIETIDESQAQGDLAALYRRVANPDGTVDDVMKVHSLNPDGLRAHFDLYISAMHRPSPLSKAERELVGAVVSRLNGCEYCLAHHAAGLRRHLPDDRQGLAEAVRKGEESEHVSERERAMLAFARRIALEPGKATAADIGALREAGLDDREILDLTQVIGYFAYANRIVLALGAELEEFPPGQHPKV